MAVTHEKEDHQHHPRFEPTPGPGRRESVSVILRRAREAYGQDLRSVAQVLRIRQGYLEAIEGNDYERLPGMAYALGFVRTYAEFLGLDGDEVVDRFKEEVHGADRRTELVFPEPVSEGRIPGAALVLISVVLLGLAYGGWIYLSNQGRTVADLIPALPEQLQAVLDPGDEAAPDESTPPVVLAPSTRVPSEAQAAANSEPSASREAAPEPLSLAPPAAIEPAEPAAPGTAAPEPLSLAPQGATEPAEPAEPASAPREDRPSEPDAAARPAPAEPAPEAPSVAGPPAPAEPTPEAPRVATAPAPQAPESEPGPRASATTSAQPAEPPRVATIPPAEEPAPGGPPVRSDEPAAAATSAVDDDLDTPPEPPLVPQPVVAQPVVEQPVAELSVAGQGAASPAPPAAPQDFAVPSARSPRVYGESNEDSRIVLRALQDSWVQVRDGQDALLLTRVLRTGDVYHVPDRVGLTLLTGNAGGIEITVDGVKVPPLGPVGAVRRQIALDPTRLLSGTESPR